MFELLIEFRVSFMPKVSRGAWKMPESIEGRLFCMYASESLKVISVLIFDYFSSFSASCSL